MVPLFGHGVTAGKVVSRADDALDPLVRAVDEDDVIDLYHGSREGFVGGKFSLEMAAAGRRATHQTSQDIAIFMTDDLKKATKYSTPFGEIARSTVPRSFAEQARKWDTSTSSWEFKFTTQEQVDVLNQTVEVKSTIDAIRSWWHR
jgi:hypothetical protein